MSSNAVAIEQAAAAATPAPRTAVKTGRFGVAERIMAVTVAGFVCTVITMFGVGWATENLQPAAIAGLVTAAAFSMVLVSMIRRGITAPLREMTLAYQNASKGNYRLRSSIASHDEMGELAGTVNLLLDNIAGLIQTRKDRDKLQASIVKLLE